MHVSTIFQNVSLTVHQHCLKLLLRCFNIGQDNLQIQVRDMISLDDKEVQTAVAGWLEKYGLTHKEYLHYVVNRRCPVDGLFLWLAVRVARQHVNLIHASVIWTSHHSEITVLTDASIIMIIGCFLVTPKMTCEVDTEDTTYIKLFSDPRLAQTSFVEHPYALSDPIKNLSDRLEEIGLEMLGSNRPIQDLLAELWECDALVFCMQLCDWLQKWSLELPIVTKWLAMRGLDLDEYVTAI